MKNIKSKIFIIVITCMLVIAITPAFLFGELKTESLTMTVGDSAEIELTNPVLQMVAKYETAGDGNIIATAPGGQVEAYGPGEAEVEIKVPFRTMKCKVAVLGFEESELTMLTGQTKALGIQGASEEAEYYSSDKEVIDIVNGELVALKDGVADIVCYDNGYQVFQSVYVAGIKAEKPYLFAGNKMQLSTNESLVGKSSGWVSSDPLVATVDETGAVEGVAAGSAEISCKTADGQSITTTVNVIGMKETDIYLQAGDIYTSPLSSGEGFDSEGIEWRSDDKDVVRIDEAGNMRAVAGGEAQITCFADGQKLTGKVHVMSLPEQAYTAVGMDSKLQISNAGNSSILWRSSDESKVKVSDGVLKGVGVGTAQITATTNNKTLTCDVSVVQLSNSSVEMKEESEAKTIKVAGAQGQEVSWASADTSIAQVSQTGEITPINEGKTTVFCNIGPSTMTIPVTVEEKDLQQAKEVQPQSAGDASELPDTDGTGANAAAAGTASGGQAPQGSGTTQAAAPSQSQASQKPSAADQAAGSSSDSKKESSDSDKASKDKTDSDKAEKAEKVENDGTQLTGAEAMIACGNYYNSVLEEAVENGEKWVYSNSSKYVAQSGTFEKMLAGKIRGGNCASIANWAFRDMGIISNSEKFYGDGSGNIRNYNSGSKKLKSKLDEACQVINGKKQSFGSLVKEGKVKVGDVIIGQGHTFVYRGNGTVFASGHDTKWHKDKSVKSDDSNKAVFETWVIKYKGTYDERFKVHYIIRVKDSFIPKYYRDEDGNLVKNR